MRFTFRPPISSQRALIHNWLAQDFIAAWIHGEGLQKTLDDLDRSFDGPSDIQHWIAYDGDIPFAYLLTSTVTPSDPEYNHLRAKKGGAITLDLFICDKRYLGKGLGHILIQEFLLSQFPHVAEIFIDPESTNTRAIHVYEKAGFSIIGTCIPKWHPVPHVNMRLDMDALKKNFP